MKYVDRSAVLGYKATLNFISGRRGIGKSWTFKDYALYHACVDPEHKAFIYMRRYKNELKVNKDKIFNNVQESILSMGKFTIRGDTYLLDNKVIGYAVPLSTYIDYKSVPFEKVSNVLFDEAIIENTNIKRYIPDECEAFCSFMSTVLRSRKADDKNMCRFWVIGNLSTKLTPYNAYFHLPPFDKKYYDKDRLILVYPTENNEVQEEEKNTQLERVLRGTDYYNFNFKNTPIADVDGYIKPLPKDKKLFLVVKVNGVDLGVYYSFLTGDIFISKKHDKTYNRKVTLDRSLPDNYIYLNRTMNSSKIIRSALYQGRIYYDTMDAKILAEDFIKYVK